MSLRRHLRGPEIAALAPPPHNSGAHHSALYRFESQLAEIVTACEYKCDNLTRESLA